MPEIKNQQPDWMTEVKNLPNISESQIARWTSLQLSTKQIRSLISNDSVQESVLLDEKILSSLESAERILGETKFSFIFFGGTGVGKSTVINSMIGRDLLPTGNLSSITGVTTIIEQVSAGEKETFTIQYWSSQEFADRIKFLCQKANISSFDVRSEEARAAAQLEINDRIAKVAKSGDMIDELKEYLDILDECISLYVKNKEKYDTVTGKIPDAVIDLSDPKIEGRIKQIYENGYEKGNPKRLIRLIKYAKFSIAPPELGKDLFLNGHLRIIDVPGLGASMLLHQEITENEMRSQDAMIGLVTDTKRADNKTTRECLDWLKNYHLSNLPEGEERNEAAAKIFMIVNLHEENVDTYKRLRTQEGLSIIKNLTDNFLSKNYWNKYKNRGRDGRPFFLVLPRPALYAQGVEKASYGYKSNTEQVLINFKDFLPNRNLPEANAFNPDIPENRKVLLEFSEIGFLREQIANFVKNNRIDNKLNEAESAIRRALLFLKNNLDDQLRYKGVTSSNLNRTDLEREVAQKEVENWIEYIEDVLKLSIDNIIPNFSEELESKILSQQGAKSIIDTIYIENTIIDAIAQNKKNYRRHVNRMYGQNYTIDSLLSTVQHSFNIELFNKAINLSDSFSIMIENEFIKTKILEKLEEIVFPKKDDFLFDSAYSENKHTITQCYEIIINHLKSNLRNALQQSFMYELLKNEEFNLCNAYKKQENKSNNLNDILIKEEIEGCINIILDKIINYEPLSKGITRLFLMELDKLEEEIMKLIKKIAIKVDRDFEKDEDLRNNLIQKINTNGFDNIANLLRFRENILIIENDLNKKAQ